MNHPIERAVLTAWIIFMTLAVCVLLSSCSNKVEVPTKVVHSGETKHVISIEINIPTNLIELYDSGCKKEFTTEEEITLCSQDKQQEYIDGILNLIEQFQGMVVTSGSI